MSKISAILDSLKTVAGDAPDLTPAGKYGVAKLTPIIVSIVSLGIAFEEASRDGLGWRDAFTLAGPILNAAGSFKHYKEAAKEFMDLDASEAAEIAADVKNALGEHLRGDVMAVVTAAVSMAPLMIDLLQAVNQLRAPDAKS